MDNLEEIDRSLEKFNLPRLNQEEIEIMNNLITSTENKAVIKNLPKNKSPGPDGFTGEFYETFRVRVNTSTSKTSQTHEKMLNITHYSVQFSRSVMSDSLQPHELQHARPPCPSPIPGVHPNPCPLSR